MPNKYRLHITPSAPENDRLIYHAKRITLRDKLLTSLFGGKQQYVVIMPSERVDGIVVEPIPVRNEKKEG